MADTTIAQRFVEAFGGHDMAALAELYDEQVVLYSPLVWGQRARQRMLEHADGRIAEQWVGHNSFQMPYMDLVQWQMDFPRHTPHPKPVIAADATEAV
jgi:ketosteroid isomerase-like protein